MQEYHSEYNEEQEKEVKYALYGVTAMYTWGGHVHGGSFVHPNVTNKIGTPQVM